jgi:hypothetical protein
MNVRDHYTIPQQDALVALFELARQHLDTGGGSTAAKLLLGLYNGNRFPFDLIDLRRLDAVALDAAMTVIEMDARRTWAEVHVVLGDLYGVRSGVFGAELEHWAHFFKLKGRCTKEQLPSRSVIPAMGV